MELVRDSHGAVHVWIDLFGVLVPVEGRAAAAQPVRWRPDLWIDVDTIVGQADLLAEMNRRFPNVICREDLGTLGAEIDEETAPLVYLAVMAWGLGSNVRRGRRQVIRGLKQRDERHLLLSAARAEDGLSALWQAHFRESQPPLYLGGVPFGTEWLHAAGWSKAPAGQPKPLIFDQYARRTLANCIGTSMVYPGGATRRTFSA